MKKTKLWRILFIINILLVCTIGFILWNKFHIKKISLDLSHGEIPVSFLSLVEKDFPNTGSNDISLTYIFNDLPSLNDVESINKLFHKHKNVVDFYVFFHKKFRSPYKMNFPFVFVANRELSSRNDNKMFKSNYILLIKNKRLEYIGTVMKILETNFLLERYVHPENEYKDYALSKDRLKKRIVNALKKGNKNLLNIATNSLEVFETFKNFSKIFLVVASCTTCELKEMIADMKIQQILDNSKYLILFPIHAQESQLLAILEEEKINLPIYIDINDEFDLFSVITGEKTKLITVEDKELEVAD